MVVNPWALDSHLWETPTMSDEARSRLQRQNLASLERKITYCLKRPDEKLHFQRVENWTTGQIRAHMVHRGITLERISKNLHRTQDW